MIDNKKLKLLNKRRLPIVFIMALIFTMPGCGVNGRLDLSKLNPNYGNRPMSPSDIQRREQAIQNQQAQIEQERASKRQEAEQKETEIERQKPVPAHPPKARNTLEAEFSSTMEKYALVGRNSRAAAICGIRSESWYVSIERGLYVISKDEQARLLAKSTDREQFRSYSNEAILWSEKFAFTWLPNRSECQAMINSKEIDALDMLQYRMTGGYH